MGRAPLGDVGLKKGPWTPDEDQKLIAYIQQHGHCSWRALPKQAGLLRCGKSCRLRWTNYLRPDIKRGRFSTEEEQMIVQLHAMMGNRWSAIAAHLPGRTDNEIKNYWNTHIKKKLLKMGIDPMTHKPKSDLLNYQLGKSHLSSSVNHMAQWESARLEAEARLAKGYMFSTGHSGINEEAAATRKELANPVFKVWKCGEDGLTTSATSFGQRSRRLEPTSFHQGWEQSLQGHNLLGKPVDPTPLSAGRLYPQKISQTYLMNIISSSDLTNSLNTYPELVERISPNPTMPSVYREPSDVALNSKQKDLRHNPDPQPHDGFLRAQTPLEDRKEIQKEPNMQAGATRMRQVDSLARSVVKIEKPAELLLPSKETIQPRLQGRLFQTVQFPRPNQTLSSAISGLESTQDCSLHHSESQSRTARPEALELNRPADPLHSLSETVFPLRSTTATRAHPRDVEMMSDGSLGTAGRSVSLFAGLLPPEILQEFHDRSTIEAASNPPLHHNAVAANWSDQPNAADENGEYWVNMLKLVGPLSYLQSTAAIQD